jgi:hypothetical protein
MSSRKLFRGRNFYTPEGTKIPRPDPYKPDSFASAYPNLANWVLGGGWVEIGRTDCIPSLIRALDEGGMVFEGDNSYPSLDAALEALDVGIKAFLDENS